MADQETGVVLVVLGVVIMAGGIFFWPLCGLGILLLIVGILLLAVGPSRPTYYVPQAPYAYPPPQTPPMYAPPACPVCGNPLTWIAQYNRWYCARCQAYR